MRILQIVTQMEAAGAQKVAYLLTEGLRARGHEAELWFLYKKRQAYVESAYLRVLHTKRPSAAGLVQLALRLRRELLTVQPEAIITHTHSANAFAAPIAAAAGVPVRVAVHHNPLDTYSPSMRCADRLAFAAGCYSTMVAVSGGVLDSFSASNPSYRRRLHRIYNAVAPVGPHDKASRNLRVRSLYGIPATGRLLVNVGRLTEQKNQQLLLPMLRRLPSAFLLLVGEGERRRALLQQAHSLGVADRLRFSGELPCDSVAAILKQADLFLLPSLYESFCLAAVEAMQCGLPVVASDLPCLREVLGPGQIFFRVDDAEDLTRKVDHLLANPQRCEQIGRNGRGQAARFTVERMVGEYECLLAEAALYARPRRSTMHDLGRMDALRGVPRVDYHL